MPTVDLAIPLLVLFILVHSLPTPSVSCPPHQKEALLHFKSTLNIDPSSYYYNEYESWSPNSDCCSWNLVNCDKDKIITGLNLTRAIPSFGIDTLTPLFHIQSLKLLDISYNGLVGPIPKHGFGNLTQLVILDLSWNNFSGSIPISFGNLTSLRVLILSNNILNGVLSFEVGKLQHLEMLDLRNNSLTGNIPEEIGNLTKLRKFYLANNHFSGGIPSSVADMKDLEVLDFSFNKLSGEIPSAIVNMKNLEVLDFSFNKFSMQIPTEIGRLPNMTTLQLSSNYLTGPIPSSMQNLSKLQTLWLQNNKLTGDIPTWLFKIRTLKNLFIAGKRNNLTWNNKAKIVPRCSLQQISMPSCGISGQIPEWISSQKGLYFLNLSGNKLEGRFPYWLAKMDMEKLILFNNKLTGSIPHVLFESEKLDILHLSQNNFSGELPKNIGNAIAMKALLLSENNLSGRIPISIRNMHELQLLDLSFNKFFGENFLDFNENSHLDMIDLSYNEVFRRCSSSKPIPSSSSSENNYFEGFIPTKISNLTYLRILDLSGNNLTGSIPLEIANFGSILDAPGYMSTSDNISYETFNFIYNEGEDSFRIDMQDLIVVWKSHIQGLSSRRLDIYSLLDLSNNRISGEIPASLGNLKSLKVLNISNNNISGRIPVSFGNLKEIESLDLSHNKLSGSIPQSLEKLDGLGVLDVSNNRLTGKIPMCGHMSTMDEFKYFANNSGLCGVQIKIKCTEDIPPSEGQEDFEDDAKLSWIFWAGTSIGFPIGRTKSGILTELHLNGIVPSFDNVSMTFSDIFTPLFQIQSLKLLDISMNWLVGEIHGDGFRNLTELVHLDLSRNKFNGSIPQQLFWLENLRDFDIRQNSLNGELIIKPGSFRNLTTLWLSENQFEGSIPPQLYEFERLRVLDLSYNNFHGVLRSEIGKLRNLESLNLNANSLSGNIPEEIGNLTKLRDFSLKKNRLSGGIPSSIANMKSLVSLDFSENSFSMQIPSGLGTLPNMTTLDLSKNEFTGSNLIWNNKAKIVPRCSIHQISMRNCGISREIPAWISSQKDLRYLDLSENQVEGRYPDWLAKMEIETIVISDNKLTGSIPPRIFESQKLRTLDLSRNNFSGELPENIGNASAVAALLLLFLTYNDFSGKISTIVSTYIQKLILGGNKFSSDVLLNLTTMDRLEHLDLHNNEITGNLHDLLPQIPTLQVLNLRDNFLEGFIPRTISNLTSLRILDLSKNRLTGSIPQEIVNIETMIEPRKDMSTPVYMYTISDVHDDDFTATPEFQDLIMNWKSYYQGLPSLELGIYAILDLSDNRISGEIPSLLGNLKALKVLNVSHNNVSGHIPTSFGNLEAVESLDLSHNKISGSIPESLAKLNELAILDVSNNKLTGKIPMGGQMSTMNELKYFANNSGLCGMQIRTRCPEDIPPSESRSEEDEKHSWILWEGTWIGFPIGLFASIFVMGYSLNFLQLFKFW
ncbi:hypothetical protein OSB04_011130 [Centaurea solstitialis]|uniref:Leucine-rich repeat-containing N-terminal plant-type domain-containing protein n=1 Tax=Centaurea solstitialis TaxID=347529 RepID=A0AA38TLZ6_9ASTR|nr:hypothetical protein OSB04_011130 [Centaurea solstitialis]